MLKLHRAVQIYTTHGLSELVHRVSNFILDNVLGKGNLFLINTWWKNKLYGIQYEAVSNPYKKITISTKEINYRCDNVPLSKGIGSIIGGDWDQNNSVKIQEYWRVKGLKQRYEYGKEWEDTDYFKYAKKQINESGEFWGYRSIEQFKKNRLSYVDQLHEKMAAEGYVSEEKNRDIFPKQDFRRGEYYEINKLEPLVLIGRDGTLFLRDGNHRFAIADTLGLDIQVQVLARHKKWQEIREEISKSVQLNEMSEKAKAHLRHPDVNDIIPSTIRDQI